MAKITIFYEENNTILVPSKLIIYFGPGKIRWDKETLYIPFNAKFKRQLAEDFQDDVLSFSVTLSELVMNAAHPDKFGISLSQVLHRFEELKKKEREDPAFVNGSHIEHVRPMEYSDIEQFVVQIPDIIQVMQMDVRAYYI